MQRGGRLLAFFLVAARFAVGPELWWHLDLAGCRSLLRPCRGASSAGSREMMELSPDSLVIKVRAPQPECALPRCLSTLRSNLMLPLWAALVMLWLSWRRRGPGRPVCVPIAHSTIRVHSVQPVWVAQVVCRSS
jgi:hypothetical protein